MTSSDLSILVIDTDTIRGSILEDGLRDAGYQHVTVISDMDHLVRRIAELEPDVIFIDLENPNRDMLEHMFAVSRSVQRPIAMFVDQSDTSMIEAAVDAGVSTYIVDGLKKERVKPILDMTISRFNAVNRLREELEATRGELADRKVIDRAKGILMKMRGLSEDEAYKLLRKTAMDQNRRVAEVAESLITSVGMLGD
ncbi:MAG: ANTAR domain-containing response regulator [Rhodospirillales bacterium]|nr:ANTAR domain-containing response regulator [Rhodospirillales bacterium]MBO6788476.1 ANTAR domain-containing response regulator [Rhodospirillales bacterium]